MRFVIYHVVMETATVTFTSRSKADAFTKGMDPHMYVLLQCTVDEADWLKMRSWERQAVNT